MAFRAADFVSKRLQRATFAFLCLALAQLLFAMGAASAQHASSASAQVHIQDQSERH